MFGLGGGHLYYIAVVGAAQCGPGLAVLAEKVGEEIARRGCALICGGRGGVMEAASRGAQRQGGLILGVLPGKDPREGNNFLTMAVATGLGEARNAIITRTADAIIAVGGRYGTLSEIALALKMGKPVVGLKTWKLKPPCELETGLVYCDTAAAAVETALAAAGAAS